MTGGTEMRTYLGISVGAILEGHPAYVIDAPREINDF